MLAYDSNEDGNERESEEGGIGVGDKVRFRVRVICENVLRAQVSESFLLHGHHTTYTGKEI